MSENIPMQGGGTLTVCQEGGRVRLFAVRELDRRGLYKVWVQGKNGAKKLIGTLVPEGRQLCLNRTFSVQELEQSSCWPIAESEAVLAFPFQKSSWYCEQHPEQLIRDQELKRAFRSPMLCCRQEGSFRLAAPLRTDKPVALEPIVCLACMEQIEGRPHLIWKFDGEGKPIVPEADIE